MKSHVRAAAAAVALSHGFGRDVTSVYDYNEGGYKQIKISVTGSAVNGYDYDNSCYISGSLPSLYHYGESSYLQLTPNGTGEYKGYDYDTSSYFSVKINGNQAQIYDYGEGSYFTYSA
jgi:hypothetical protein